MSTDERNNHMLHDIGNKKEDVRYHSYLWHYHDLIVSTLYAISSNYILYGLAAVPTASGSVTGYVALAVSFGGEENHVRLVYL